MVFNRTDITCDAHMWAYRHHLRGINRRLAEEYIRQGSPRVLAAIEELANAAPVALAIAQFHKSIRRSPAINFWPVIRQTRGTLLVRSTKPGEDCPWPWRRTKKGNLRYALPGYLLFSPWPTNVYRSLRRCTRSLQRLGVTDGGAKTLEKDDAFVTFLPGSIFFATLRARLLILAMQEFQGLASPDSMAALDRWSNEPQRVTNIALRISQRTLVYDDGSDHCEIEIPDAFTKPLLVPSTPDRRLELHWVRVGRISYWP